MKILILANNDIGLFKFRKELLEELVKKNKVYISVPDGEFINDIKAIGCRISNNMLLDRRGKNPVRDLRLLKHYYLMIRRLNPDIVFTYTIKPNIYGGIVCTKKHVPYVANITGLGTSIENGGMFHKLILLLYKVGLCKARKVFFQNASNLNYFLHYKIVKHNFDVLPGSGVNTIQHCYEPYPEENKEIVFTTIGRIMKDKGIEEILSAAEEIKREYPKVRFRLVGYFDENYEKIIREAEKKGIIEYIEHQKDIHSIIVESHAIIHASYHEGMSNVLLEAASTGRPVIATNVPGCRETFEDGISGISFEPKSSNDLIRAIRQFISLPYTEKELMGKAGREKIEREFDRNIVIEKYKNEVRKILEE